MADFNTSRFVFAEKRNAFCALFAGAMLGASAFLPLLAAHVTPAYAIAPAGFSDRVFADDLKLPTAMKFEPDGKRLFVLEKEGAIRVVKEDGTLLAAPFASLSVNSEGERGLLGIAFDPNFASNGYIYVYYTTDAQPVHNRVSRLAADPSNPDRAAAGSETHILDLEPLATASHNGGALDFGPDGKLYVSTGDNYYPHLAQALTSRFGKILRINPDGTIPEDNPFYNVQGAYREIWALGLRNPFTFAFSHAAQPQPGKFFINDVGQDSWEEINLGVKGGNYGWPACEGPCPQDEVGQQFANPVYSYAHPSNTNEGSSITGGAFYQAAQFPPEYMGSYFFADYTQGSIKRLASDALDGGSAVQALDFIDNVDSPIDIKVGPDGYLYYLSIVSGQVRRVLYTAQGNHDPAAVMSANQTTGVPPLAVGFDGSQSTDQDGNALLYSWDFGDGTASSGQQVAHAYNRTGLYDATLTVSDGNRGLGSSSMKIMVGNPPRGTILAPAEGTKYNAGDTVSFSGSATNGENGTLPASAFHWTVLFHHNTHTHPFQEFAGVTSGSFTIPTVGETDDDVWYRVHLVVTDPSGLTHESTRDILPNKSMVVVNNNATGLKLVLDGQPRDMPLSFVGVAGAYRTLEAPAVQVVDGMTYRFQSWSDGGERVHTLTIPAAGPASITAYYGRGTSAPLQNVTIASADMAGNALSGHYATVRAASSSTFLQTGFTPLNFTGFVGTAYTIAASDYQNSTFDHWEDGSTARERTITLSNDAEAGALTLTAYYRTAGNVQPSNPTTPVPPLPPPPRTHSLSVASIGQSGSVQSGIHATIEYVSNNNSSTRVYDGDLPATFIGIEGGLYRITVGQGANAMLDHWEDGSTNATRMVGLASDTALTAYFRDKADTQASAPAPQGSAGGGGGGASAPAATPPNDGSEQTQNSSASSSTAGSSGGAENTFPDSYFVSNPLAKVQLQDSGFVRADGERVTRGSIGEQITIFAAVRNYQQSEQPFTSIIQVLDEEEVTAGITILTDTLGAGRTANVTSTWNADREGTYTVKTFVWDGASGSPRPLSEAAAATFVVS
jgi:glucose/arabinose dehydrogenase